MHTVNCICFDSASCGSYNANAALWIFKSHGKNATPCQLPFANEWVGLCDFFSSFLHFTVTYECIFGFAWFSVRIDTNQMIGNQKEILLANFM